MAVNTISVRVPLSNKSKRIDPILLWDKFPHNKQGYTMNLNISRDWRESRQAIEINADALRASLPYMHW